MRILSVVGARPQFVKLAPISLAMESEPSIEHVIVHTGQHYDANMSDVFFEGLSIPKPDINLAVGSGTHSVQTGAMLARMDAVFEEHRPDLVLVYGDTNSTLAGTLSAVKLHIPVAHLEAGLRSFNRAMPYLVATIRRAENTGDPKRLATTIEALQEIDLRVLLLAHPRLVSKAQQYQLDLTGGNVLVSQPLAYHKLICAVMNSTGVVTDSGGLQKEAFLLRKPCTTVRTETEWVETVELGWNVLANTKAQILESIRRDQPLETCSAPYGEGTASLGVVKALIEFVQSTRSQGDST